jgi:hypothetical protein
MKTAALCSAIAALVLVATAASAAARTAHVSVMGTSPFTVRGTGFRAHERVTVTVFAKTTRTKRVTAGARGGFTAAFSAVTIGRCEGYAIRAKGNRGSIAVFKTLPECAQPGPSGQPDVLFPIDPPPKHP